MGREGPSGGLAAEDVPLPIRISVLARDVLLWQRLGGPAAARDIVSRRRGKAYDPQVVDAYLRSVAISPMSRGKSFSRPSPPPHGRGG